MGTDFQVSKAKQIFQWSASVFVILVGLQLELLVFTFPLAVVATYNIYSNKHRVMEPGLRLMEPGLFCLAAAL